MREPLRAREYLALAVFAVVLCWMAGRVHQKAGAISAANFARTEAERSGKR